VKPPGTERLKLKCEILLSTYAFKFNLRRYIMSFIPPVDASSSALGSLVGRCSLTALQPVLKAPMVYSALETVLS